MVLQDLDSPGNGVCQRSCSSRCTWHSSLGASLRILEYLLTYAHSQSVMDPRIAASNSCSSRPVEVSMLTAVLRYLPNLPYQVDHDKVFGVYAILKKRLDLPDPDYARPIQEVFQAVAGSYIIDAGSLASLWMTLPLRSSMGLPSWVPDCLPSPTSSSNVDTTGTFGLLINN